MWYGIAPLHSAWWFPSPRARSAHGVLHLHAWLSSWWSPSPRHGVNHKVLHKILCYSKLIAIESKLHYMASHVDMHVINTIMWRPYGSCRFPQSSLAGNETIMYKQHSWALPNHRQSLQKWVWRSTAEDKTSGNSIFQADFHLARSAEISGRHL